MDPTTDTGAVQIAGDLIERVAEERDWSTSWLALARWYVARAFAVASVPWWDYEEFWDGLAELFESEEDEEDVPGGWEKLTDAFGQAGKWGASVSEVGVNTDDVVDMLEDMADDVRDPTGNEWLVGVLVAIVLVVVLVAIVAVRR